MAERKESAPGPVLTRVSRAMTRVLRSGAALEVRSVTERLAPTAPPRHREADAMNHRLIRTVVFVAACSLLLLACGSGDEPSTSEATNTTAEPPSTTQATTTSTASPSTTNTSISLGPEAVTAFACTGSSVTKVEIDLATGQSRSVAPITTDKDVVGPSGRTYIVGGEQLCQPGTVDVEGGRVMLPEWGGSFDQDFTTPESEGLAVAVYGDGGVLLEIAAPPAGAGFANEEPLQVESAFFASSGELYARTRDSRFWAVGDDGRLGEEVPAAAGACPGTVPAIALTPGRVLGGECLVFTDTMQAVAGIDPIRLTATVVDLAGPGESRSIPVEGGLSSEGRLQCGAFTAGPITQRSFLCWDVLYPEDWRVVTLSDDFGTASAGPALLPPTTLEVRPLLVDRARGLILFGGAERTGPENRHFVLDVNDPGAEPLEIDLSGLGPGKIFFVGDRDAVL